MGKIASHIIRMNLNPRSLNSRISDIKASDSKVSDASDTRVSEASDTWASEAADTWVLEGLGRVGLGDLGHMGLGCVGLRGVESRLARAFDIFGPRLGPVGLWV
jgi:hypothetical protein